MKECVWLYGYILRRDLKIWCKVDCLVLMNFELFGNVVKYFYKCIRCKVYFLIEIKIIGR